MSSTIWKTNFENLLIVTKDWIDIFVFDVFKVDNQRESVVLKAPSPRKAERMNLSNLIGLILEKNETLLSTLCVFKKKK
jgi:hypothetical protein